ncbi:hypothetical protein HK096_006448, partial [Nowakowskiella sp. JEL0078]
MDDRENIVNLIKIQDYRSSSEAQRQIVGKEVLENFEVQFCKDLIQATHNVQEK